MKRNEKVGESYGLGVADVPEGHQATLRPVEGSDTPQVSIEPVPDNPQPDTSDPAVRAGLDAHRDSQADATEAFAAEHEKQLQDARDAEIAAAGESSNIGTDGRPHFSLMREREKANADEPDHEPAECGTCGTEWPCEQAREIERREAEARGEQSGTEAS